MRSVPVRRPPSALPNHPSLGSCFLFVCVCSSYETRWAGLSCAYCEIRSRSSFDGVGAGIGSHLPEPAQVAEDLPPLRPEELHVVPQADVLGVLARERLQPPAEVWAPPGPKPVAACCCPEELQPGGHQVNYRARATSIPARRSGHIYTDPGLCPSEPAHWALWKDCMTGIAYRF